MPNFHENIKGPAVAVDTVTFTVESDSLKVLLIKIGSGPYQDKWALPGALVGIGESLDETALRVLRQKANIITGHLEQLYSFGKVDRDVRGQVVSVAYMLLIDDASALETKTSDYYTDIAWFEISALPPLAFDHLEIIKLAHERLCDKASYSNVATFLSPSNFTLTELQKIYEAILAKSIDKRNFRKKILALGIIAPTKLIRRGVNRPAKIYKFTKRNVIYY